MSGREEQLRAVAEDVRRTLIAEHRDEAARGSAGPEPITDAVRRLVDEGVTAILDTTDRERIANLVLRETVGLGVLEELLEDPGVEEVLVNGPGRVYIGRAGVVEPTDVKFPDEEALRDTIERIIAPLGRRVDELSPMADARLADGSRVNVVIPPLAVDGPALSIRRFGIRRPNLERLVEIGTLVGGDRDALVTAVLERKTILVSGGTGSGKTTLLNALSEFIGEAERVITIEDAAELRLLQKHVVRLETRPASVEGRGEVTIRDLLRNALRMRPDRIVIGEVRGPEALDLLTALNTGHEGALSTVHANSPADALNRLQTLCLMAGVGLSATAIAEQLRRGIDLIVQIDRQGDGSRRVREIAEPAELEG